MSVIQVGLVDTTGALDPALVEANNESDGTLRPGGIFSRAASRLGSAPAGRLVALA
jgi:hypothetical protein